MRENTEFNALERRTNGKVNLLNYFFKNLDITISYVINTETMH